MTDVDIDVYDRTKALAGLDYVYAMVDSRGTKDRHNTGVYFQPVPKDPETNLSRIAYKEAEELGYFKIDFLNVSLYADIRDEEHLKKLIDEEPRWELLDDEVFTSQLFHIGSYHTLVKKLQPRSVEQLAAILAIIRPAKRYLENESWNTILKEVWSPPTNGAYYFKKAHSFAYALAIVVQINLIVEQLSN